jgi:hypothetical protein
MNLYFHDSEKVEEFVRSKEESSKGLPENDCSNMKAAMQSKKRSSKLDEKGIMGLHCAR